MNDVNTLCEIDGCGRSIPLGTDKTVKKHLDHYHGPQVHANTNAEGKVRCIWPGCNRGMAIISKGFAKHIAEKHLHRYAACCPLCSRGFSRVDACIRHARKQHDTILTTRGLAKARKYSRTQSDGAGVARGLCQASER